MVKRKEDMANQPHVAVAALILNLVLPGLGTIVAGKKDTGKIQFTLTMFALPFTIVLIGFPLYLAMWIWALTTSVSLIKHAKA